MSVVTSIIPAPQTVDTLRVREVPDRRRVKAARLLEAFVVFEIFCQIALLWSVFGQFRFFFRFATFASSLALLALVPKKHACSYHPAAKAAKWVMVIMFLELLNPEGILNLAAPAQIALYLAVLGPLFWVARVKVELKTVRNVIFILWAFHTISSVIGILQVRYPGSFQFNVSSVFSHGTLSALMYRNGSGHLVFRPTGLSDIPGGAATSGLYAALLALLLMISYRQLVIRIAAAFGMFAGLIVIYLSMVKAVLVTLVISVPAFLFVVAWRNSKLLYHARYRMSLIVPAAVAVIALVVGFSWGLDIGGRPVAKAVSGLTAKSPGTIYYGERGGQMEFAINKYLPEYPLGAGVGRWGMMCYYFGDLDDTETPPLWAEIQWPGWLFDGGIALLIAYPVAILIAIWLALRLSLNCLSPELGSFAIFVFAYDIGCFALTFDCAFFMGQDGIMFWLLNAMLFAAAVGLARARQQNTRAPMATSLLFG